MIYRLCLLQIFLVLGSDIASFAQAPAAAPPSAAAISKSLQNGEKEQIQKAIDDIRAMFQSAPLAGATQLGQWIDPLLKAQRNAEVEVFALKAILLVPHRTDLVEQYQQARVRALLAAGKPKDALSEAKALYNVATMYGTAQAITAFVDCLAAAHPDDPAIVNRFKLEQVTLALAERDLRPATQMSGASVLSSITVDPKPYEATLKALGEGADYNALVARGNLLLLSDRAPAAKELFERAYTRTADADYNLTAATENLARQMKAEDGTVGRANAWVLSLRPKEH